MNLMVRFFSSTQLFPIPPSKLLPQSLVIDSKCTIQKSQISHLKSNPGVSPLVETGPGFAFIRLQALRAGRYPLQSNANAGKP
jgi:hypothetical protein